MRSLVIIIIFFFLGGGGYPKGDHDLESCPFFLNFLSEHRSSNFLMTHRQIC